MPTSSSRRGGVPHYAVTTADSSAIKVLGTQPIDVSKPHPFAEAGNREFNSFVWMPPKDKRAEKSCSRIQPSSVRCLAPTTV